MDAGVRKKNKMGSKSRGGGTSGGNSASTSSSGSGGSRKRKASGKKSKPWTKEEAVRRFKVSLLRLSSLKGSVGLLAVAALVLVVNMGLLLRSKAGLMDRGVGGNGNLRVVAEPEAGGEANDVLAGLSPLERIRSELGGLGKPLRSEKALMKERGVRGVVIAGREEGDLRNELGEVERAMNAGWNRSELVVLPLGQHGYVKRDLPVYRDGFQRLGGTVLSRPKAGTVTVEQLKSTEYTSVLCLSFNTDHCFDPAQYEAIGRTRKVNRIQNLRDTVWSKHKFCRTVSSAMRGLEDPELLSFTFPCWVMPTDYDRMVKFSHDNDVRTWIAKPRSLGAGMGIYIVTDEPSLEREKHTQNVVQTYLEDPHLISKIGLDGTRNLYKWDMRSYVLVTSVAPIRAYVFTRGLVRISTSPYTTDCKTNITACLTNTSLNKKVEGANLKDITWSFKKLKDYLAAPDTPGSAEAPPWDTIFLRIQRAIGLTLLSAESEMMKRFVPKGFLCENCYQLLGVDLLFDAALQPKVVEINGEPNLKLTGNGKTHYDFTKRNMARDLTALVFHGESSRVKASQRLVQWANAVGVQGAALGEDHLRYILATLREHSKLGGFRPVYPIGKLAEPYGRYLRFLRDKESKNAKAAGLAHHDGRRYRLHQVVTLLQSSQALAEQPLQPAASGGSSSSSRGGGGGGQDKGTASAGDNEGGGGGARRRRRRKAPMAVQEDDDDF